MSELISHRAAVLGHPIEHSRSPVLHNAGYAALGLNHWHYGRFDCDAERLPALIGSLDSSYRGLSVTMPAKFAALRFATEVTQRAELIGSANTLVRIDSGWRADNTDVDGIRGALGELLAETELSAKRAVVIGGGGTARPAIWALLEAGVSHISIINRSDRSAELRSLFDVFSAESEFYGFDADISGIIAGAAVVISTVPAAAISGLEDSIARIPLLDVIYDPWPTPLIHVAQSRGIPAVGGHVMLAYQAFGQFEQFTGEAAPRTAMRAALTQSLGF